MSAPVTINNTISELRQKKGWTQEELANKVHVSRQTIISIEKGNYIPSLSLALLLSHEFAVTVEKLFWLTKK